MDPNRHLKQLFLDYENGMIDRTAYRNMRSAVIDDYLQNLSKSENMNEFDASGEFGSIPLQDNPPSRSSYRSLLFTFLLLVGAFIVYVYSTGVQT